MISSHNFLAIYSGAVTIAFAGVVLVGARKPEPNVTFDQITVHRINIVEPDGTTRMVLSDRAEFPGSFYLGKEYPEPTAARPACSSMTTKVQRTAA